MNRTDEKGNEIVVRSMGELQVELFTSAEPVLERNRQNTKDILAAVMSELQPAINIAQAESLADAYKTVDDVVLQKGSDGNYTATLRDGNGKILKHVPLKKASSCVATAIKEAFAVNCAIAGQAQMMQISKQLEGIRDALSEQKQRDWSEKANAVQSAMMSFRDALTIENDSTARLTRIMASRTLLRAALLDVFSCMESQVERIPCDASGYRFFDNWMPGKTKSEKAEEYFRYFVQLIPSYCQGVSMLAMTEAYVDRHSDLEALYFANRFREMLGKHGIQERMVFVPTVDGKDPQRMMNELINGLETAVEKLEIYSEKSKAGELQLKIHLHERC